MCQKQRDPGKTSHVEVVGLVVGVDDRVQRLDGGERLHGLINAPKVARDLLGHVLEVLGRLPVADLERIGQLVPDGNELGVNL